MTCDRFEERLQEALDQRRSPCDDWELRAHALRCPECRELLEAQRRLLSCFASPAVQGSAVQGSAVSHSTASLLNECLSTGARMPAPAECRLRVPRSPRWAHWTALATSLCAVVVLVSMVGMSQMNKRPDPSDSGVVAGGASSRRERQLGASLSLGRRGMGVRARQEGSGASASGVATSTIVVATSGTTDVRPWRSTEGFRDRPLSGLVSSLGDSIRVIPGPGLGGVQDIAEGFRPVTRSMGTLVDALRQTWPSARAERDERVPDTSWVGSNSWIA